MESEHEPIAPRYRICNVGFWISGLALALLGLSGALTLWGNLTGAQGLLLAMQQPWFTWGVELPITAGALLGSYLLWGRWSDANWQRRAGLLVAMNLFDAISWGFYQASEMGAAVAVANHHWLVDNLVMLFGWVEFFLFADLAAEVASHLKIRTAHDAGQTARRFCTFGFTVSLIFFVTQTRWDAGWPLIQGPWPNLPALLMWLGVAFLRVLAALQVATLCFLAGMACRRTARELSQEAELASSRSFDHSGFREQDPGFGPSHDESPW